MAIAKSAAARPYAKALFELARDASALQEYAQMLGAFAFLTEQAELQALLSDPRVSDEQILGLYEAILPEQYASVQAQNCLRLLLENNRIAVLPELFDIYQTLRAEHEKTINAEIFSFKALSDEQKAKIAQKLKERLQCEISIEETLDEDLIGGFIVKAGDLVIDNSVRGKLAKLKHHLDDV